jgi:hypothetical protein
MIAIQLVVDMLYAVKTRNAPRFAGMLGCMVSVVCRSALSHSTLRLMIEGLTAERLSVEALTTDYGQLTFSP